MLCAGTLEVLRKLHGETIRTSDLPKIITEIRIIDEQILKGNYEEFIK